MKRSKLVWRAAVIFAIFAGVSGLVLASSVSAQSVNLIEEQLIDVRKGFFELGPFYATPVIAFSAGYDSNALSTPDPQEDILARIGPGARLGLPMGSTAFFDLYQEVDFVYYREQTDLRRVFNITRVGGGWGGRRLLLTLHDEFRDETTRPTSEFDFPVESRTNRFDVGMTVALGWRQKLKAGYQQLRSQIRDDRIDDPTIPFRLNNTRHLASVDLRRKVTTKTEAIVEGFFEEMRFDDITRDNTSYGARFGFDFSPTVSTTLVPSSDESGVNGKLLLGFRKLVPTAPGRVDYTGLIGTADVSVTAAGGHRVRGVYERDVVPSILDENWYFVQNRIGGFFRWQLHDRFSVEPGAIVGRNDYPLPQVSEGEDGEPIEEAIFDEHNTFLLTIEYRLRESWFVGVTTQYLDRRSNVTAFAKDRLLVSFNFAVRP